MKKQWFLFALSVMLLLQTHAQTELLTLAENKFNGPVKSATTKAHWMKEMFGELEIDRLYFNEYFAFNKDGLLTASSKEESNYYKKESSYKYDENNRLIQKKEEYGKEKEKKHHSWKLVYDAQGRETEQNFFDDKGKFYWKHKLKYQEDGKLKESVYYNGEGDVSVRLEYSYSSPGQLISTKTYNPSGKTIKTITAAYDKEGNKIKEEINEEAGKYSSDITRNWTYSNGRKTRESKRSFSNNTERLTIEEFDQWGNVIKRIEPSGTVLTTTYIFDSYNNWITATCSWEGSNGPVTYRQVREIKYY
jgi:YD repeat-containing protein